MSSIAAECSEFVQEFLFPDCKMFRPDEAERFSQAVIPTNKRHQSDRNHIIKNQTFLCFRSIPRFFSRNSQKLSFFHSRVMNLRPSMDAEARGKTKSQLCLKYYRLIHLNSETETLFSKQGLKRIAAYEPRMGILGREPWFDSWSRSLISSKL